LHIQRQVIAAVKLFREHRLVGAQIDLDSHFGNSIEGSVPTSCAGRQWAVDEPIS
jgi:hypothetical protein